MRVEEEGKGGAGDGVLIHAFFSLSPQFPLQPPPLLLLFLLLLLLLLLPPLLLS